MTSTLIWYKTKINLVSGPPGSGKTTWAKKVVEQDNYYVLIDDPKTRPTFDENCNYLITDPKLCYRDVFDKVNQLYPEAHWIFFRPDAIKCLLNVKKRFENEPDKFISVRELARFCSAYELNFKYYVDSVSSYQIEEIFYELVE